MNRAQMTRLVRETYEHWNGPGSWDKASNWRKSDWRKMVHGIVEKALEPSPWEHERPQLPSEIPVPPQPVKPRPSRPLRADALDENPD